MQKQLIHSGTTWETAYGYSRAVRMGNFIAVSGTTAIDGENNLVGGDSLYLQTVFIYQKIEKALQQAGANLSDIVRLRIYITHMQRHPEVLKAQGEFFAHIRPAATIVEVSALIDERLLVEIEADAIVA